MKTLQQWLEATFTKNDEYKSIFLNEKTLDNIALKDFNVDFETKDQHEEVKSAENIVPSFTREDLPGSVEVKSEPILSVISFSTSNESETIINIEAPINVVHKKNTSSWKRPDLVEKRVIRALCDVVKDYFNDIAKSHNSQSNLEKLTLWDKLIETCFPDAYKTSRLKILGQVCVNTIGWKFAAKINSLKSLNTYQRKQLLKFGDEFREQRNSSKVEERKVLLNHPIIKIGKLLYETSSKYECSFWKHIEDHKKSLIEDSNSFQEVHKALIKKVPSMEHEGDLITPNLL